MAPQTEMGHVEKRVKEVNVARIVEIPAKSETGVKIWQIYMCV